MSDAENRERLRRALEEAEARNAPRDPVFGLVDPAQRAMRGPRLASDASVEMGRGEGVRARQARERSAGDVLQMLTPGGAAARPLLDVGLRQGRREDVGRTVRGVGQSIGRAGERAARDIASSPYPLDDMFRGLADAPGAIARTVNRAPGAIARTVRQAPGAIAGAVSRAGDAGGAIQRSADRAVRDLAASPHPLDDMFGGVETAARGAGDIGAELTYAPYMRERENAALMDAAELAGDDQTYRDAASAANEAAGQHAMNLAFAAPEIAALGRIGRAAPLRRAGSVNLADEAAPAIRGMPALPDGVHLTPHQQQVWSMLRENPNLSNRAIAKRIWPTNTPDPSIIDVHRRTIQSKIDRAPRPSSDPAQAMMDRMRRPSPILDVANEEEVFARLPEVEARRQRISRNPRTRSDQRWDQALLDDMREGAGRIPSEGARNPAPFEDLERRALEAGLVTDTRANFNLRGVEQSSRTPPRPDPARRNRGDILAGVGGGAIGAGALALGSDAEAQETSSQAQDLRAELDRFKNPQSKEDIQENQRILRGAGLYDGPIDGVWARGTQAAAKQYVPDLERRLREAEEQDAFLSTRPSKDQEFWRGFGGMAVPYAGGALAGLGARGLFAQILARGPNRLLRSRGLPSGASLDEASRRASNVNEFARLGGAGEGTPFVLTPGQAPGFRARSARANPRPADPSTWFQPSKRLLPTLARNAPDIGVASAGAGEVGLMHVWLQDAHQEVEDARAAIAQTGGKTRANYIALNAALDKVATLEAWQRAGIGLAGGSLLGLKTIPRARPNVALAERETMGLNRYLAEHAAQARAQAQAARIPADQARAQAQSAVSQAAQARTALANARAAEEQARAERARAQAEIARLRERARVARERKKKGPPTRPRDQ